MFAIFTTHDNQPYYLYKVYPVLVYTDFFKEYSALTALWKDTDGRDICPPLNFSQFKYTLSTFINELDNELLYIKQSNLSHKLENLSNDFI